MKSFYKIAVLLALLLPLPGCEGTKKQLGMTRDTPDEFAVVKRAPLEMPPEYTLPPPQPGAPRPQEARAASEAQAVIFGAPVKAEAATPAEGETILLQQAGAESAEPGIRRIVDQETTKLAPHEKPVAERLLGIIGSDKSKATVVDAKAESERLKRNAEEGKPVTEGETPTVRR